MTQRRYIVAAARALVGTPYLHQGRVAGPHGGTDCVGVPVLVARACGFKPEDWDVNDYRPTPDGYSLLARLRAEMGREVGRSEVAPGDVLVVDWGRYPHHVAVVGDYPGGRLSIIHADNIRSKVIEHRMVLPSTARFVAAFQFPGVENV